MSDTWQQPSQGDRLPFGEPYPGFAHTHQEYYEQHRRQQAQQANAASPISVPTIRQVFNPWWYPTFPPGFPPEKVAEVNATIREKRRNFYTMLGVFMVGAGASIYRFFS